MQVQPTDTFWVNALEYPPGTNWQNAFQLLATIRRTNVEVPLRKNTTRYGFLLGQGENVSDFPIAPECEWEQVLHASGHWKLLQIVYSFANHPEVQKVYVGMTYLNEKGSSSLGGLATRGLSYDYVILIARGDFELVERAENYLHRAVIHPKKEGDRGYPGRGQNNLYGLYLCFSKRESSVEDKIPVFYRTSGQPFAIASVPKDGVVGSLFNASFVWKEVDDALTPFYLPLNLQTKPVEGGKYFFNPKEEEISELLPWPLDAKPAFVRLLGEQVISEAVSFGINVNNNLVRFVKGFGADVLPDAKIVLELDAVMELKRFVYALLADLENGDSVRTRNMIAALMWGLYKTVFEHRLFKPLIELSAVQAHLKGADNFIFWQHVGNCAFFLHLLNNTPLHEVLQDNQGDLLWIAFVLYMESNGKTLTDALVSVAETDSLRKLFEKWKRGLGRDFKK